MAADDPVLFFPDRASWRAARRKDVTASDIGALVNVHPYKTPFELWSDKVGIVPADHVETPAMRRGHMMEAVAVKLITETFPDAVISHNDGDGKPLRYWRDPAQRIGATPDVLVNDPARGPGVIQIKSIEPGIFRRLWQHDNHAIDVPLFAALQALTEAKLTGSAWAAVAALRVGHGIDFDLIDVPLHEGAWNRLRQAVVDFWTLVDTATPPPPDYQRDGALIARLYPQDAGTTIDMSHDNEFVAAVHRRVVLAQQIKQFDAELDEANALIRHKAGEAARVIAGDFEVNLKTVHYREYTVAARTGRPVRVKERKGRNDERISP